MENSQRAGQKRQREDDSQDQGRKRLAVEGDSSKMEDLDVEEFKRQKQIEAGIESVRKIPNSNLMIEDAAKHLFKNVDDKKRRFKISISGQFKQRTAGQLSKQFGKVDQEFVDLIKKGQLDIGSDEIGDLPSQIKTIYSDSKFVEKELMQKKDYRVTLSIKNTKATRQVSGIEKKNEEEEDNEGDLDNEDVRKLQAELKNISLEFGKTDDEIARAFVSVSGSTTDLRKLFKGEPVVQWTYLEDRALTKEKDSIQYKCILDSKGQEEVERRIQFLISHEKL